MQKFPNRRQNQWFRVIKNTLDWRCLIYAEDTRLFKNEIQRSNSQLLSELQRGDIALAVEPINKEEDANVKSGMQTLHC